MKTPRILPSIPIYDKPRHVKFDVQKLKIENLKNYFVEEVIDLAPRFQRGRVWNPKTRKGLIKNILHGKPIPAIFWYKTQKGPRNNFIILDGKQRLETLLLYIGNQREDFQIPNWTAYIHGSARNEHGFKAIVSGKRKNLKDLDNSEIVKLRDYNLSIIEIEFDDDTSLQEIVELFVDINQSGVKVTRFEIVKSLYREDPLLNQVLGLIAIVQKRRKDLFYKSKSTPFNIVLKHLDIVKRVGDSQIQIDVMRERLFEFALFAATGKHRKPSQILKDYISQKTSAIQPKLDGNQLNMMEMVFQFLKKAGRRLYNFKSPLVNEQTHFYILVTYLLNEIRNLPLVQWGDSLNDALIEKLIRFDSFFFNENKTLFNKANLKTVGKEVGEYAALSERQTTDTAKRQQREECMRKILKVI
jgi:Protein of unknown function DUF262